MWPPKVVTWTPKLCEMWLSQLFFFRLWGRILQTVGGPQQLSAIAYFLGEARYDSGELAAGQVVLSSLRGKPGGCQVQTKQACRAGEALVCRGR